MNFKTNTNKFWRYFLKGMIYFWITYSTFFLEFCCKNRTFALFIELCFKNSNYILKIERGKFFFFSKLHKSSTMELLGVFQTDHFYPSIFWFGLKPKTFFEPKIESVSNGMKKFQKHG